MANADKLTVSKLEASRPGKSLVLATENFELFIPVSEVIDLEKQINRLEKDLEKTKKDLFKVEKKLNNPKFISSAPEDIVKGVKQDQMDILTKIEGLKKVSSNLNKSYFYC